jgi:hypothetical protein
MAWVATAIVGSAVVGGAIQAYSANKAADAQVQAANTAAQTQLGMYNQTRSDLAPFRNIGGQASAQLSGQLSSLTAPISVNPDDFLNSDAYKFLQSTGEKAVTNSAAARGLGQSGAALKGAAAFESGLNSQFYQQNFNNQVTNQTNAYNRLKGLIDTGENAAAQTGSAGTAAASGAANAQIGAGNAQAAAANATGSVASNIGNTVGAVAYKGLYGGNVGNMPATGPGAPSDATSNMYALTQGINPF